VITVVHLVSGQQANRHTDQVDFKGLKRISPSLVKFIEPDFGLLNELRDRMVLSTREVEGIRDEKTVSKQNEMLLSYLKSPEQREHFVEALGSTGQQHVANWIEQRTSESFLDHDEFMFY